jgi:hypothetical protein
VAPSHAQSRPIGRQVRGCRTWPGERRAVGGSPRGRRSEIARAVDARRSRRSEIARAVDARRAHAQSAPGPGRAVSITGCTVAALARSLAKRRLSTSGSSVSRRVAAHFGGTLCHAAPHSRAGSRFPRRRPGHGC